MRGVVVGAGRNRASVDVEGDAQRRSLGNDETSLALQVGVFRWVEFAGTFSEGVSTIFLLS